ncbi:EAL domain-containing protein [Sinorhizobium sp. NFACC03]|uniref:EAL domain-containing protein n=1 Tax=Sinorhizobium sp. NFACC03 TaxID=1566295 RepID=UPI0008917A74|nr:EAL domain-containing protein [Sinorhizobium sp. NFACC03]SDA66550.1 PAS domain S-box-containing protein/diguanylate cyclase (GGDEF) domain-containing protein [Sinorhizobium sp. NFACC03]
MAVNEGLTKGARGAPANSDVLTQAALERLPAGAIIANDLGRIITTNARAGELLPRTPASLRKALLADLVLDEDRPLLPARNILAPTTTASTTLRFESLSGPLPMLVSWSPVLFADQDAFLLLMLPAHELVDEIAGLRNDETRWKYALDSALEGVWDHDFETGNLFYSTTWKRLRGLPDDAEVDGSLETWIQNVHPDDHAHVRAAIERQDSGEAVFNTFEYRERHADGHWVWIESRGASVAYWPDGRPSRIIGTDTDITARKEAEARLEEVSRRLRLALGVSKIGVFDFNLDAQRDDWDERMFEIYGLDPSDGPPSSEAWESTLHPDDRDKVIARTNVGIASGKPYSNAFRIVRPDGTIRHIRSNAATYIDHLGTRKLIGANWDVTEDIALQEDLRQAQASAEARNRELELARIRIEYNALHDYLTDLPNRRYLDQMLAENVAVNAILHIDLDRFKQINDTLGHQAGDAMLTHAAAILRAHARHDDFIARIGGDEFVILCRRGRNLPQLSELAERIVHAFRRPIPYEGQLCRLGASIGIAWKGHDDFDAKQLLMNADIALYRAKSLGRDRVEAFSEQIQTQILTAKRIGDDIRQAIEEGQFTVYYQPQFDARSLEITGVEALVRWNHPERGVLTPFHFLKVAEEINVLPAIDRKVVELAYADFQSWRQSGFAIPKISVNMSSPRLRDPGLIADLRDLQIAPGVLSFELLESIFLDDPEDEIAETISALGALGIEVEIDDFGTGHASIIGLLNLNPARLKIDRALVGPMTESPKQAKLVRAIIDIGHSLNIEVVGEGVETWEHAAMLRDLGCDVLQGYALARPMDRLELERRLRRGWKPVFGTEDK